MKSFENKYLLAESFLPPIYKQARQQLLSLTAKRAAQGRPVKILDVGGRKSHYTIGVPAEVTVSDLPRESDVQKELNLGVTDDIMSLTSSRRSNLTDVVYDDMTKTKLPESSFDIVVAIEVLEHVEEDAKFVSNVSRVLKPGGAFFMTTPNGDSVENTNPDHKRHYLREQLHELLAENFDTVDVWYAIQGGKFRTWGLKSWSAKKPIQTALSMAGNVINTIQSSGASLRDQAVGPRHLFALATKKS